MKTKLLSAAIAGFMAATPVMAELTFSALSYRTGAYGNNGIPFADGYLCLLYTSPSPRDVEESRMPSSA